MEGEKILETVLLPRKAGEYKIPSLSFSYFDPKREKYVTLRTKALRLKVRPTTREELPPLPSAIQPEVPPREAELLGEDIRFIKTSPGSFTAMTGPLFLQRNYWIWNMGAILAALMVLAFALIWQRLRHDVTGSRVRSSHRVARQKLKSTKSYLKAGHEKEFYEALSRSIYGYFADKLNIELAAVGIAALEMKLEGIVLDKDIERIKDLFSRIDYGRFSTAPVSLGDMKKIYHDADELISYFEGKHL